MGRGPVPDPWCAAITWRQPIKICFKMTSLYVSLWIDPETFRVPIRCRPQPTPCGFRSRGFRQGPPRGPFEHRGASSMQPPRHPGGRNIRQPRRSAPAALVRTLCGWSGLLLGGACLLALPDTAQAADVTMSDLEKLRLELVQQQAKL